MTIIGKGVVAKAGLAAGLLALAACHGSTGKEQDGHSATGEVLPGSISDAMLPYDTLKSKPPLAPRVAKKEDDGGDGADSGDGNAPADSGDARSEEAPKKSADEPNPGGEASPSSGGQ